MGSPIDFVSDIVETVGGGAEDVIDWTSEGAQNVGETLDGIPIVGGLLGAAWSGITSPVQISKDIRDGVPLDEVALRHFEREIANVKAVAPYAQTVISFVPGIGPIASGAISAGIAIANGQPIDEILLAGVKGAIPGGPLVGAVYDTTVAVVQGKGVEEIGLTAVQGIGRAAGVPIPVEAERYLAAGLQVAKGVASGETVDSALLDEAIAHLPAEAQKAAIAAKAVGNGAALSDVLMDSGLDAMAGKAKSAFGAERAMTVKAKKIGATKTLLAGTKAQPVAVKRAAANREQLKLALQTGLAMGTGAYFQKQMAAQAVAAVPTLEERGGQVGGVMGSLVNIVGKAKPKMGAMAKKAVQKPKLVGLGKAALQKPKLIGLGKALPGTAPLMVPTRYADEFPYGDTLWQEGEGFAGEDDFGAEKVKMNFSAAKGAKIGVALAALKPKPVQLLAIRKVLPTAARSGFDAAMAANVGMAREGIPEGMSPEQAAAYLATKGMVNASADQKQGIAESFLEDEDAREGLKQGIQDVNENLSWLERILKFFGLR